MVDAKQSCQSCKYYQLPRDKEGKIHLSDGKMNKCTFKFPTDLVLPTSITGLYHWHELLRELDRGMLPYWGTQCPTYIHRRKKSTPC